MTFNHFSRFRMCAIISIVHIFLLGGNEMKNSRDAVIVAWGRAPVGKGYKGSLANIHPLEYAASTLRGVLAQLPMLDYEEIDDIIVGCSLPQDYQGDNMARLLVERAQLPYSVSAQTINRLCSSGLQAIATCANAIRCGAADVMVAGGVDSMSKQKMGSPVETHNEWLEKNVPGSYMPMGLTAENVAEKYHITRTQMDQMAVESHAKAAYAQEQGWFDDQIIPFHYVDADGNEQVMTRDEGVRPGTTLEKLGTLKPCFKEDGIVTAATSSQVSDSASFVVLMSREKAEALGAPIVAKFCEFATAGVDPAYMGEGPIKAVPKVLKKLDMTIDQMDTIELNEAFAAQAIPCIKELGMDPEKVNPTGGAMALGHPLGATGCILTCKVISQLRRLKGHYGMVTMCIGGGQGAAAVFELEN